MKIHLQNVILGNLDIYAGIENILPIKGYKICISNDVKTLTQDDFLTLISSCLPFNIAPSLKVLEIVEHYQN